MKLNTIAAPAFPYFALQFLANSLVYTNPHPQKKGLVASTDDLGTFLCLFTSANYI